MLHVLGLALVAAAAPAASYSFNTALQRPFECDKSFVVLKLHAFFPPVGILAEHALQIAMVLSSTATEKNFQTREDMFTDDYVMSRTA